MIRVLRYLNIEVALGVIAIGLVAARAFAISMPWWWFVIAALASWCVYTLDRLIDTRNASHQPDTSRHRFHARHKRVLFLAAIASGVAALLLAAWFMPWQGIVAGCMIGMLTLSHVIWQRSRLLWVGVVKDVNVAVTYTLAAWCIPYVLYVLDTNSHFAYALAVPLLAFIGCCLCVLVDVMLLSILDEATDVVSKMPSIARSLPRNSINLTLVVCLLLIASIGLLLIAQPKVHRIGIAFMVITTSYALMLERRWQNIDNARLLIDCTLLLGFTAI